ncbi:MAG: glycosyltransferase [Myxococcales bacterium]
MPHKHWDFVLSCFEPLVRVTGGIGTYTRLLLQHLETMKLGSSEPRILLLTPEREDHANEVLPFPKTRIERIPLTAKIDGTQVNNFSDVFFHFSFGAMQRLRQLAAAGHTFGTMEFPDYGAEGYYPLKARKFGLLHAERTAVRLHSPLLMLHEDNNAGPATETNTQRFFAMERYIYEQVDHVLFGGDAMRDRVTSVLPERQRADFLKKCVKIPHPWPAIPEQPAARATRGSAPPPVHVGYVGRLEWRKGVDLMVEAAVEALPRLRRPMVFHFYGRDTHTHRGASIREYVNSLIPKQWEASFQFHNYVPQDELWAKHLPKMDAFVFPSRFENYPNVLLEVLPYGKPVLVSQFGCMPEMGRAFPNVRPFNPADRRAFAQLIEKHLAAPKAETDGLARYQRQARAMTKEMERGYAELLRSRSAKKAGTRKAANRQMPTITFVSPHYNHAQWITRLLASLSPQMRKGDEVIVVDDCSRETEAFIARARVEAFGGKFISTNVNSGPSKARNLGARQAKTDLVYFVDSDDELLPSSVDVLRQAFADDPKLEVASGLMHVLNGDQQYYWAAYDPIPGTILFENSCHAGIVLRRDVFAHSGGYDEQMRYHLEDWEFHARLALTGRRFEVAPIPTYRYHTNPRAGRDASRPEQRMRSYQDVLERSLRAVPVEKAGDIWPEMSAFVAGLITRNAQLLDLASYPRQLRYRLADKANEAFKNTRFIRLTHGRLKRIISRRL